MRGEHFPYLLRLIYLANGICPLMLGADVMK
jgi:hypothetical protein